MAVEFRPVQGTMGGGFVEPEGFPGDLFAIGMPEAIGDARDVRWPPGMEIEWSDLGAGAWQQTGEFADTLRYELDVLPGGDFADVRIRLWNHTVRLWEHSLAFNCFGVGGTTMADHECSRHWVGLAGRATRLHEVPRQFSPRPTIQLYSVAGAPRGEEIPFVAGFEATPPDVTLEPWIAIVSRESDRLVAAVSQPCHFLFQNMEYSCIHAAQSLGRIEPGGLGEGWTRLYFARMSLPEWRERVREEMGV